jgi:hypothetical protein
MSAFDPKRILTVHCGYIEYKNCAVRSPEAPPLFYSTFGLLKTTLEVLFGRDGRVCAPGGALVAIYRLFSEAAFDPEDIRRMSAAYEAALQLLRLNDRNDPVTELVAAKIVQVFRLGETDPPRICARALKELGVPIPD